ncbi:MAG TPA: hypothetical protein VJA94_15085 [Candidatus Angelobacter sp.]
MSWPAGFDSEVGTDAGVGEVTGFGADMRQTMVQQAAKVKNNNSQNDSFPA